MNKVKNLKETVDSWLLNNSRYMILNETSMDHPIKKELMTFNIVFSDSERSISYSVVGVENDAHECCMHLDATFFTGINEDINETRELKGCELDIKNIGKSGEAVVKLTKWVRGDENLDFEEYLYQVIENGINRLTY